VRSLFRFDACLLEELATALRLRQNEALIATES
jgi:hypothetical protein